MTWRPFSPPRSEREPRPVSESLERIAGRLGLAHPDVLSRVFARWDELVGVDVAAHATPRSLREGVLIVTVDHPAWASSLRLLSGDLMRRINAATGPETVSEVVVRVDGAGQRSSRNRRA
jgi:predicted nucleic acid-binding Zn ribbon protein